MGRKPKPFDTGGITSTDPPPYLFAVCHRNEPAIWYQNRLAEGEQLIEPLREKTRQIQSASERLDLQTYAQGDIGQIRAIYYRELVLGSHYHTVLSGTIHANTSFFCSQGVARYSNNWLIHDLFLSSVLRDMGISFFDVEAKILELFWQTPVPSAFRRAYQDQADTNSISLFEAVWTERMQTKDTEGIVTVKREGKKYLEHQGLVPEMETIVQSPQDGLEHYGTLSFDTSGQITLGSVTERDRLLSEALFQNLPQGFKLDEPAEQPTVSGDQLLKMALLKIRRDKIHLSVPDNGKFPEYRTNFRSPFINRIIFGLFEFLREAIDGNQKSNFPIVHYLIDRKSDWVEAGSDKQGRILPMELYWLVADILYHLPIVQGLPDTHRISEATHPPRKDALFVTQWRGLTADEVRQRYRTEKTRQHRATSRT